VSDLAREINTLIQSSIPRTVHVKLELQSHLPLVEADAGQIEQLIMNLVINGAEAIGEGNIGTVVVSTGVQNIDEAYIRQTLSLGKLTPGPYVYLEVQDTGSGMDEATRARIFDPFFTTKVTGRGLGLAAVLGIVEGHKGALTVSSAPGKGSTFKVMLPAVALAGVLEPPLLEQKDLQGAGTILVIDDEEMVRCLAKAALESYGYKVLVADNGVLGVETFTTLGNQVILVLLDMTMPVMSGKETLRRLKKIRPDVPVVLSSGYNEVETVRQFASNGFVGFIQKPYTAGQLAENIKTVLEARSTASSAGKGLTMSASAATSPSQATVVVGTTLDHDFEKSRWHKHSK
jgi:CheY-like chemotaxis protein